MPFFLDGVGILVNPYSPLGELPMQEGHALLLLTDHECLYIMYVSVTIIIILLLEVTVFTLSAIQYTSFLEKPV